MTANDLHAFLDRIDWNASITIAILVGLSVLSAAIYYAPFIIAYRRRHSQRWLIFWFITLFGWTLLGWFFSWVWALRTYQAPVIISQNNSKAEELARFAGLRDQGVISEEEFQSKKRGLLI